MANAVREVLATARTVAASASLQTQVATEIEREVEGPLTQSIQSALRSLTLEDAGIISTYFCTGVVTHVSVFSCSKFGVEIYCIPAGTVLPVHLLQASLGFSAILSGKVVYRKLDNRGSLPDGTLSADISIEREAAIGTVFAHAANSFREVRATEDTVLVDLLFDWSWGEWRFFEETERRVTAVALREIPHEKVMFREKGFRGSSVR